MIHSIAFKKRCNTCFQSDNLKHVIQVIDFAGNVLEKLKIDGTYNEEAVRNYVILSKANQESCRACNTSENYTYLDLEVDNAPIGKHIDLISKDDKSLIKGYHSINLRIGKIFQVNLTTNIYHDLVSKEAFTELTAGIIDINDRLIKMSVFDPENTVGFNLAYKLLFVGLVQNMTFSSTGEIQEIKGRTVDPHDQFEKYFFVLKRRVKKVYNTAVANEDNMYIEIQCAKYGTCESSFFKNYYMEDFMKLY